MQRLKPLDDRIPHWETKALVERRCPFCSSQGEPAYIRPDALQVISCKNCGAFFVSPSPNENALADFYNGYHQGHRRSAGLNLYLARMFLASSPFTDWRMREINSIMDLKGKVILDVGCGLGQSMSHFAKLGAIVSGIDLDPEAVDFVESKLGFEVSHSSLAELHSAGKKYDVICMKDFIEHPLDPLEALKISNHMLNPNGILLIWSPNASLCYKEHEPILFRVDLEHMQYISTRTCNYLSQLLNLEIAHLETVGYPSLRALLARKYSMRATVRSTFRKMLGFAVANRIRMALRRVVTSYSKDIRDGTYHLFCMMRKTAF